MRQVQGGSGREVRSYFQESCRERVGYSHIKLAGLRYGVSWGS